MATEITKPVSDADIMTGFNPAYGVTAEEIEARQDDVATDGAPEGEATERSDASAAPTDRDVTLDGRTFKAPRDLADAFTREINRRDGTRGAEIQTLRERLAHLEGRASAQAPGEVKEEGPPLPDPELQIENPAEYQKQLLAHVEWKQEQKTGALASQYEAAEAQKERESSRRSAWQTHVDAFYARPENAVLRENKDIVDLVFQQNAAQLAPLSVEDGFKELSRLAQERLSRVTGSAPEIKARTQRPPTLEGSSRRGVAAPTGGAPDGPMSLTAVLKERRREAAKNFNRGGKGPQQPAAQR